MSIKGTNKTTLFIGKQELNIVDRKHKRQTITYDNLQSIELYMPSGDIGIINFLSFNKKKIVFRFPASSTEPVQRAVEYIQSKKPDVFISNLDISTSTKQHKKKNISLLCIFFIVLAAIIICICYHLGKGHGESANTLSKSIEETVKNEIALEKISNQESIPATESYSNTLVAGHYIVGIDIPVGTYTLSSKSGSGNVFTDDGSINEIFGAEGNLTISTSEGLENIYLADGVTLSILGNQSVSIGCSDGLVSSMKTREQSEDMKDIELGNGWFTSGTDFIPGTYDIIWIEGNGNIISEFEEDTPGINEIMGDAQDSYIKEFRHLNMPEGFMLKIDDIKIKLSPSK